MGTVRAREREGVTVRYQSERYEGVAGREGVVKQSESTANNCEWEIRAEH